MVFAINLTLWHEAIDDVGAGLATVLGNLQVVIVPFVALLLFGERVPKAILYALPAVCAGVLLVSGALEHGAYGANPARGALFGIACGFSYATFILIQRHGLMDLSHPAGLLFDTSVFASITAVILGADPRRRRRRAHLAERRLAPRARADLAGARLDADHRLAPAPARGDDVADPDDPADRLRALRRAAALAGPEPAAAQRLRR